MPTLTELAQLGKQALLAFIAQLLTEFAALKTRSGELLAELSALKARVAELLLENAALKAQLEPPRAGREAPGGPLLQGPAHGPTQTSGTQARSGALHLPHPAQARPMDRPPDRGATA